VIQVFKNLADNDPRQMPFDFTRDADHGILVPITQVKTMLSVVVSETARSGLLMSIQEEDEQAAAMIAHNARLICDVVKGLADEVEKFTLAAEFSIEVPEVVTSEDKTTRLGFVPPSEG
jgi:hypothetical protein